MLGTEFLTLALIRQNLFIRPLPPQELLLVSRALSFDVLYLSSWYLVLCIEFAVIVRKNHNLR